MAPKNNERFASIVEEAFSALGVTQTEFSKRGGPSDTTLRKIIDGEPVGISARTLKGLDIAFGWSPGSAARTLSGGDPTPNKEQMSPSRESSPPSDLFVTERAEKFLEKAQSGDISPTPDEKQMIAEFLATRGRSAVLDAAMKDAATAMSALTASLRMMINTALELNLLDADRKRLQRATVELDQLERVVLPLVHLPDVMAQYSPEVHRMTEIVHEAVARAFPDSPEPQSDWVGTAAENFAETSENITRILEDAAARVKRMDEQSSQIVARHARGEADDLPAAARTAPAGYRKAQSTQGEAGGEENQDATPES